MGIRNQFRLWLWVSVITSLGLIEFAIAQSAPGQTTLAQRIVKDLQAWDSIIDHRTGTVGDNATAKWLAGEIRATGLEPIVDRFPFDRRVLQDCAVTIGEIRFAGVPLFDGEFTGPVPVRGKLGRPGQKGTIALVRFSPLSSVDSTTAMLALRQRNEHSAIVAVAEGTIVKPGLSLLNADDFEHPVGLPVLQVATEHGARLDQALVSQSDVACVAHATIERTEASNVQVTIDGMDTSLDPLVIMTPRSAWWTCTSERGGGITVWLNCIRHFAEHRPKRTVIFTANTGHELGHVGLDRYLDANKSLIKDASAWIHLGANFAARDATILLQASSSPLMEMLTDALEKEDHVADRLTPVNARPLGEARNIHDGGGAYVSILGANPLFHHPDDRWPAAIDLQQTEALTLALLHVAIQMAE